ncbi:MAG: PIN domain-containing protein [Chloroflexota bacterium]
MARYLLDTTTLIDFSKGREPTRSWVLEHVDSGDELGVSPINLAEFYAGVDPAHHADWDEFFNLLTFWSIDRALAKRGGAIRYEHARKGLQLSATDTLIAAVAEAHQAVLVTANIKDFPMDTITVISPSSAGIQ